MIHQAANGHHPMNWHLKECLQLAAFCQSTQHDQGPESGDLLQSLIANRPEETPREPAKPVYGPFADDFRTVLLPEYGHINLTEAQASVFQSLWSFKGEPMRAERIMERAGLDSDKPIDVFKVKSRDKGKPGADRPLMAYRELVVTVQRPGLYSMPCSAG